MRRTHSSGAALKFSALLARSQAANGISFAIIYCTPRRMLESQNARKKGRKKRREGKEELYKLQRLHKAIANEGMQHKTFFTCSFNVFYAFCHFIIEFAVGVPQAGMAPPHPPSSQQAIKCSMNCWQQVCQRKFAYSRRSGSRTHSWSWSWSCSWRWCRREGRRQEGVECMLMCAHVH